METELWKRPATVVRSGLTCLDCGKRLSMISGQQVLTFHCPLGHSWDLEDLVERHKGSIEGLKRVLALWREKLRSFESTVRRATQSGFLQVAETFRHEHRRLASRVTLLERGIGDVN